LGRCHEDRRLCKLGLGLDLGFGAMQTVLEYLERAQHFERLAADAEDSEFKQLLLDQAAGYRKLAQRRAAQLGAPVPASDPHNQTES
jgi:hypothetical protein